MTDDQRARAVKERPLLFTPENAQKVHDGIKTQTRRLMKPQPAQDVEWFGLLRCGRSEDDGLWFPMKGDPKDFDCWEPATGADIKCPFGVVGDQLWVREAWAQVHPLQAAGRFSIAGTAGIPGPPKVDYRVIYRGDGEYPRLHFSESGNYPYRELCQPGCQKEHLLPEERQHGWQPSIHMPRWACRTVLEITEIRVERVQDITGEDAKAEGCAAADFATGRACILDPSMGSYRLAFRSRWESINGPDSWEQNPWVWVLVFKKVEGTP